MAALVEIVPGKGKGKLLNVNGHLYEHNKTKGQKKYWRCVDVECRVSLHTNLFDINAANPNIVLLKVQ